ncbi:MAG TPA: hypothetical protein VKB36_08895 [Vicinamibacterales bacterium]|nr:hypothetical protein [Vicinamibacterales bacterium]
MADGRGTSRRGPALYGLGGFVWSLIRGKIRSGTEKGMQAALSITKTQMEN